MAFRSDDNGTVQGLVAAGFGAALVPLLAVDQADERVRILALEPEIPERRIALAWHRDRHRSPAGAPSSTGHPPLRRVPAAARAARAGRLIASPPSASIVGRFAVSAVDIRRRPASKASPGGRRAQRCASERSGRPEQMVLVPRSPITST